MNVGFNCTVTDHLLHIFRHAERTIFITLLELLKLTESWITKQKCDLRIKIIYVIFLGRGRETKRYEISNKRMQSCHSFAEKKN